MTQGLELKVFKGTESVLELSGLPKGNEFAVFYVSPTRFEEFKIWATESLKDVIRIAKSKKSDRSASFRAKFEA